MTVGSGSQPQYCVPFVSEYNDCTEENRCSGCSKCTCTGDGKWDCKAIEECPEEEKEFGNLDDNDIDMALEALESEINRKTKYDKAYSNHPLVPEPEKQEDLLLEDNNAKEMNMEDQILALMRSKRSAQKGDKDNGTITFYHTVDEINKDTLSSLNITGTIPAHKVDTLPKISRRFSTNNSTSNSLQIEYTPPKDFNHNDDNKVDTPAIHDDKVDLLIHSNLYSVIGNHSQESKNKELSKIVVNELKGGVSETIGDKNAPVISNITFTQENDTLTAMAFIAGNLLNKLWNMEKEASDDQIDTEMLKHEKIKDLLELFKEPLDMRQEIFLKKALEKLSLALNDNSDVNNISICKNVEAIKKSLVDMNKNKHEIKTDSDKDKDDKDKDDKNEKPHTATNEALHKINGVLELLNKYENVHDTLRRFKYGQVSGKSDLSSNHDDVLTNDEKSSLDLYGKTLETITNLLVPNKKSKKIVKSIKKGNIFTTGKDLNSKLSDTKLADLNVTTKDRIVLDYLAHIQSNPDCLLKKQSGKLSLPSIEGNILLNLSEFFKIKSLSDLVKLVDKEKSIKPVLRTMDDSFPKSAEVTTTETIKKENGKQFRDTKEKLKGHLKSILEDLMTLQKAEGNTKDVKVMEMMPCIYNILNAGKDDIKMNTTLLVNTTTFVDLKPSEKIQEIFTNLKKEIKFAQTRRTNNFNGQRPKSAIVWERVIKNAKEKQTFKTRRNLIAVPMTMEQLKAMISKIESWGSNTYKNYAFLNEVPPAERLLLLKTFSVDTARYIKTLEKINESLRGKTMLPKEYLRELAEFLDNVAINVNLNEKVVKNLDQPKKAKVFNYSNEPTRQIGKKAGIKRQQPLLEETAYNIKLTRDQIIAQLIKNRILLYVQTKEATGETLNDMNYSIAKKILLHLEVGNFQIAKELYKVFAIQTQKDRNGDENINIDLSNKRPRIATRRRTVPVEPLIKFEEPKTVQDNIIKQLLKLKNTRL